MPAVEVLAGANPVFALHTESTSYAFTVSPEGLVRHLHWGGRIPAPDIIAEPLWAVSTNDLIHDITAQEYPPHGRFRYSEQSLMVRFADGGRELDLGYHDHTTDGDSLVVHLRDPKGLEVDLHYRVLAEFDLIERRAVIRNGGDTAVVLEAASSAMFTLPFGDLTLRHVEGHWGAEFTEVVQTVRSKVVLEGRRGISNHHNNPFVVLSRGATETDGPVWVAALAFTGNTKCVVERTQFGQTLVSLGVNDHDLEIPLAPGSQFTTPRVVAAHCDGGLDSLSRRMHAYGRRLMGPGERPVLYNSWEATGFNVTADNQIALAGKAAAIGAELFVVDDGWFGRRRGDEYGISARDGLGDWWVDPEKFPQGLDPLIRAVKELGMGFGIWVEPEMVNPLADLYAEHPDWIYREPGREPDEARDQYVLNLTLPQVRKFVVDTLDGLLSAHDIDYVKWDANRPMSQVGAARDVWYAHIAALYDVVADIKRRHPGVLIEACASGGGRVDFGALDVFDDFWTSDNTDALDRLEIQRAYSLVYPPAAMRAWVTDVPNFLSQRSIPLQFRFHSAMLGSLGIGADLSAMGDEELQQCAQLVAQYKALRPLMGTFHRLDNPSANDYRLFQYASDAGAALFVFLPASRVGHRPTTARLRGLDPRARYRFTHDWAEHEVSGEYLMNRGIRVWLRGDYASTVIRFDKVTEPPG
jgi:alpha-galactosidase